MKYFVRGAEGELRVFMEMEGRGLSELFRNTSEDMFLKAMMENSMGVAAAAPSMEMMGFRNLSQGFREDSEELFNSWLMNGEASFLKIHKILSQYMKVHVSEKTNPNSSVVL